MISTAKNANLSRASWANSPYSALGFNEARENHTDFSPSVSVWPYVERWLASPTMIGVYFKWIIQQIYPIELENLKNKTLNC